MNQFLNNLIIDYLTQFKTTLFDIYYTTTQEQILAIFFSFVLLYVVRSLSFLKKEIKEIREDEKSIEKLITEVKHSETNIHSRVRDLKQSHKDHFKKIGEYIPAYPSFPKDRTNEVLELISKNYEETKDNFTELKKINESEIKLLELLRREIQEAREDNANSIQLELADLPKDINDITKEQYLRFNRLEKQIENIKVSPIIKIPECPKINIVQKSSPDYTFSLIELKDKIEKLNDSIHSASIISNSNQIPKEKKEENKQFWNKKIDEWKSEQEKLISEKLKETEHKIIDSIPAPIIIKDIDSQQLKEFSLPDFRRLNRDLLLQIEEVVSARLEDLNQQILNSRELSTFEIQNTINQVERISKIVTNKLLEVKPTVLINNNSEVLQAIKDLEKELSNLKNQVQQEIHKPGISSEFEKDNSDDLNIKLEEIARIFKEESTEIKTEVRQVSRDTTQILMRLASVERSITNKLSIGITNIISKMKSLSNNINDIDITLKENQNKISMLFYNHTNDLKSELKGLPTNVNLNPIIDNITSYFDIIDYNFEKLLTAFSNISNEGSKYDINPKVFEEIKHIFEIDIINQYNEQMIFLELLGGKISELSQLPPTLVGGL
ncbi:MAG: hypothetical protein H8D97_00445 [Proteobacteria bacterium]|nr:hypothetical protein [Pseudomonadota bacterium]